MTANVSHERESIAPIASGDIPVDIGARVLVWSEVYVEEIDEWRDLLHTSWEGQVSRMPGSYKGPEDAVNVWADETKWEGEAFQTPHPVVVSPSNVVERCGPGGGITLQRMVFRVIQAAPSKQSSDERWYASRLDR